MENPQWPFKTFESVKELAISTFNSAMDKMTISNPLKRRYIVVAFSTKGDKNVSRSSNKFASILFNESTDSHEKVNISNTWRKLIVAYAIIELEVGSSIIDLTDIVMRALNPHSNLFQDMVSLLLEKISADQKLYNEHIPIELICTKLRYEYTRMRSLIEKIGFSQDFENLRPRYNEFALAIKDMKIEY